ncbi:MAG: septum formation protein Maf [Candidatus Eisenbacteria bacterium]|nr:septum formation protein Maf [Candidatus Eisenbacteria bacterium]
MEVESVNDGPVTLIIDSRARGRGAARTQAGGIAAEPAPRPREPVRSGEALLRRERGPLWLASRSPRRVQLLEMLGIPFTVRFPAEDGRRWEVGEDPGRYAEQQSAEKALSVAREVTEGVILGADTVVFCDGRLLEKPRDPDEAARFLERLAGREHEVFTGICLARAGGVARRMASECSRVRMAPLDDATIRAYLATGEPLDKAGAYGIQGVGGLLVESIEGCYFNVMGLPLARLRALFRELEAAAPDQAR